jgi:hypothetical protein
VLLFYDVWDLPKCLNERSQKQTVTLPYDVVGEAKLCQQVVREKWKVWKKRTMDGIER